MRGWEYKSLSELGSVGRGKSRHRPRNADFLYGGNYPFIQTADVKSANFKLTSYTQTYSDEGLKQSRLWPRGTLCITIAANIADTAVLDFEACFPDSIIGFIPYENTSDVRFVKYCFDLLQKQIKQISQGAAQDNLSIEKLLTIRFFVPEYSTQYRIASILSAYDDLIENNLKRIKLLEELAQRTYEEWFVKFRINGEPLAIDEKTGLPEGWERKNLVDVAALTMGQSPKSEFYNQESIGLPFHQGVSDYGFRFPKNSTWSSQGSRKANKGDILFSVRAPVGRLNVAIEDIILGRGLASIRHKKGFTSFLYYQLQNIFFKDDLMGGGAIFNSVTKSDVERIQVLESVAPVLSVFNSFANTIDVQIENLSKQNIHLKQSRDILLPRLMNGTISVVDAEESFAMAAEPEGEYNKA